MTEKYSFEDGIFRAEEQTFGEGELEIIIKKIYKKGDEIYFLQFIKCEFLGNFACRDIAKLIDTNYVINYEIYFINSTFHKKTYFNNIIFSEQISFENATFSELAYFKNVTFTKDVYFEKSTFSDLAIFNNSTFSEKSYFGFVNFCKNSYFRNTIFSQKVKFYKTIFSECVCFKDVEFSSKVFFENSCFIENADFSGAHFIKEASFENSSFTQNADFSGTSFLKIAYFFGTIFKDNLNLIKATFNEPPYFEGEKIKILLIHQALFPKKGTAKIILSSIKDENQREKKRGLLIASWQGLIRITEKKSDFKRRQEFHNRLLEVEHYVHGENIKLPTTHRIYETLGAGEDIRQPSQLLLEVTVLVGIILFCIIYLHDCYEINGVSAIKDSLIITIDSLLPIKFFAPTDIDKITDKVSVFGYLLVLLLRIGLTIFSTSCLFMIALALRNKFRIK